MRASQRILVIATSVVALGGVYLLREATMSTHYETGPDSRVALVLHAADNRSEHDVTLAQLTTAKVDTCALEVAGQREGDVRPVAGAGTRFEVVLAPALDSTDRKQYQGCLEDWSVDHFLLRVVSMTDRVPS